MKRQRVFEAIDFEPGAVIGDEQEEHARPDLERNTYFGGASVFDSIMKGLFEGKEHVMPDLGSESPRGQLQGHVEATADSSSAQKCLGKPTEVRDEAVNGIVLGVDGPNNFVHRLSELSHT